MAQRALHTVQKKAAARQGDVHTTPNSIFEKHVTVEELCRSADPSQRPNSKQNGSRYVADEIISHLTQACEAERRTRSTMRVVACPSHARI